ncbi:D-alanine--D-alanyl carrier protein ligase [Methylobacterium crusticola]|uniref:D-alanine--D-alanyl carrier protein ligase n=1 Tax=Methylobacterium crusticola TaxID=1697972 RepID=A0ABQ4RA29_9HYPH|nr:Pls/PosA family non-ribosomal peptide synthetase [Methylobacterium crusticola]GJD53557.1 D-alanine--D-alanyl carrier protein ligase [Methylobacterium crusticola]
MSQTVGTPRLHRDEAQPATTAPAAPPPPPAAALRGPVRPDLLRDEVLAEIFRASARARPEHPALIDAAGGEAATSRPRMTYAEVDRRSDTLAAGLASRGIGPGDVVGLWMGRSPDLLVAQIGITKAGAAWLPFDAEAPADRVAVCLADAAAKALVVSPALRDRAPAGGPPALTPDALAAQAGDRPAPDLRAAGLTPAHPAYLIYTSGSTGVPKGIVISHRNICHFLRAANALYGLEPDDVVFQGASVAFDLSMEEIWVPYLVGATLLVASPAQMGDAEALPEILTEAGVTVLDTVPTLLGLMTRDVPALRLILLGGEALPEPLIARWATPARKLFNTYGPTEATVVATAAEMRPGDPVTIGGPIANYTAYIADEALSLVAPGVQGELLIGGPGVAAGYLARPELTAEKFIPNPFGGDGSDPLLYRSGDAVSLDAAGRIVFHGRIDDQVKIRGFRVELGEIEARIRAQGGVAQAAVVLRQDEGVDRLVAFVVPERGAEIERAALRAGLAETMPPYMIPGHFETVAALPILAASGKVDRKALRAAELAVVAPSGEQEAPRDETEAALLAAANRVFGNQPIPFEADFFADLGGHSLLAARFVSAVREAPALASITLQDVYNGRTLRAMAEALIARTGGAGAESAIQDLSFAPPPLLRRFLCGLAQALVLPFVIALATAQWLGIFVTYLLITGGELGFFGEMVVLLLVYIGLNAVTALIAIGAKWVILGRTRPGRYPLWGAYYFRWWLTQRLTPLVHVKWLQGSPMIRIYLRLLGAKVGEDALISDIEIGAPDLVSIGRGASLGGRLTLANAEVVGNELVIGRVSIGDDVAIGTSCVIGHETRIEDHAELADLTTVPSGTVVGRAEAWDGSPGRKVGEVDVAEPHRVPDSSPRRRAAFFVTYAALLAGIPAVGLLPIFPAFYIFDQISDSLGDITDVDYHYYLPLLTWPTAMLMTAGTVMLIAGIRWLVLPRLRAGHYPIDSGLYLRKWAVALAAEVTLETLSSLFATVYMRAWYRLMGAGMGKGAEISTNLAGRYDLSEVGPRNFIADEVVYGEEEVRHGVMSLRPVRTGARVFVGNDAVVPPGAVIPDDVLIGIKSKPPANDRMAPGETWFGSPPIKLPTRQRVDLGQQKTFEPGVGPRVGRGVFEAFTSSFSPMLFITFAILSIDFVFYPAILAGDWLGLAVSFVATSVVIALLQTLVVICVKWLLMGAYQPGMHPMWSWWAMRTEAVAVMYWGLAGKVLLEHLMGTPFLPWVLRLLGTRTGEGVCMLSADITEFDCVSIGDFASVNRMSALQTHLYEDRVMKVGRVEIGRGVSVGAFATVLYDTQVGDYAQLRPLTIVMKGEAIPANSRWEGAPAVPVVHKAAAE